MTIASTSAAELPLSVHAVKFSSDNATLSSAFLRFSGYGEPDAPLVYNFYYWVIRTPSGIALFDSGFTAEDAYPAQTPPLPITDGLQALGVDPLDVHTVFLSHLHYDHCGNLELFPNAEIVMQRAEWEFAHSPMGAHGQCGAYFSDNYTAEIERAESQGRLRLVDGDTTFAPGLELITLAGHSAGSQGLIVETVDGSRTVLAGDAGSFYDAWRKDRPLSIVLNLPEMYAALARLRSLEEAGATVVPAHDAEVVTVFGQTPIAGGGSVITLAPRVRAAGDPTTTTQEEQ